MRSSSIIGPGFGFLAAAVVLIMLLGVAASADLGDTTRVSVTSNGDQATGNSEDPAISADGRYIVFDSFASNLVPDDTNGAWDVFVHDTETGETTRVSLTDNGEEATGHSVYPAISADGRHITFESTASDLVPDDTNNSRDVFVHDTETGETTRVSLTNTGDQATGHSYRPAISSNGRYVTFESSATNLVPDDTNSASDVFVHDTETGETTRVSINSNGTEANGASLSPAISADGRHITFESDTTNLVTNDTNDTRDVFVHQYLPDPPPPTTTTTTPPPTTSPPTTPPPTTVPPPTTLPEDPTDFFTDDDGHTFEDDINAIAEEGITIGCNPPENTHFCPDESFLRGQAAAFLRRALNIAASSTDHFVDDDTSVFEGDINAIAEEGITIGCNPPENTMFCPTEPFTRGQAAAFLRRALNIPATETDHFTDDDGHLFERDINAIAEDGITIGCNPPDNGAFCPGDLLTRGQAAAFTRRALLP